MASSWCSIVKNPKDSSCKIHPTTTRGFLRTVNWNLKGAEKKYIVRLTDEERETLRGVMKKLKGSSQQVRRAQMLLKADANGPNWTEKKIAEAFLCRTKTVDNVRQRLVTVGVEIALHGEKPQTPPHQKRLDGEQEAQVIALRLGKPPQGFAHWSLRLLAEQVVELAIVDTVSHETLGKTLKKTTSR